jgi:hypothetical protein
VGGYGRYVASGHHLRFGVEVFSGDVRMLAARRTYPPGFTSRNSVFSKLFNSRSGRGRSAFDIMHAGAVVCNVVPGARYYLGVFGGTTCSEYSLVATEYDGPCQEESIYSSGAKHKEEGGAEDGGLAGGAAVTGTVTVEPSGH